MLKPRRVSKLICCVLAALCLLATRTAGADETRQISNDHIQVVFAEQGEAWRLARVVRGDGSDALEMTSDEFEVWLFDGQRFTVDAYQVTGDPNVSTGNGTNTFETVYRRKTSTSQLAPESVTVTYRMGSGPYLHKTVYLGMAKDGKVDRLEVLRFSTPQKATRGGEGQPVFIGNWFVGVEYPVSHNWHSDGFVEPDFRIKHPYTVDLEGADREFAPRPGLVTCCHFPGYARRQADGRWGIASKRAVLGLSRKPGENAELALLDYVDETRLRPRSYLNFNNWFSSQAKNLEIPVFVDEVAATLQKQFQKYGATLDGMVPDDGWQNGKTFTRIYEPKPGLDLSKLQQALARLDTGLGLWIALDGTKSSLARGIEVGYRPAYAEGFDRSRFSWMDGNKAYFDILDPKYQRDLREALRQVIVDGRINYIKHDFNHNFTSAYLSQRHAREACMDVTLELLAYERQLNPRLIQNFTNGPWFSPWLFQHAHVIWMMSGDSGGNGAWPQLSLRAGATAYRDAWLYESFNNPSRCVRPLIRIADLMTHGIQFTKRKPFTDFHDTLGDWSDYVVMYYARGTTLKELYLDPELLDEDYWKVLGLASAWAQANQARLLNTVLVGGNCAAGEVYGYVSWVGDKAILTARNPDRRTQTLRVPFDASAYYRGEPGRPFHARAIYPFVEELPQTFTSGQPMTVEVSGDSMLVLEITPGAPQTDRAAVLPPLPACRAELAGDTFNIRLPVPDEEMLRYDLLVEVWGAAVPKLTVNGTAIAPRLQDGGAWTLAAYDLRQHRGQTLAIEGRLAPTSQPLRSRDGKVPCEVWVVADRPVVAPPAPTSEKLPFAISQTYRRQTQCLLAKTNIAVAAPSVTRNKKDPK